MSEGANDRSRETAREEEEERKPQNFCRLKAVGGFFHDMAKAYQHAVVRFWCHTNIRLRVGLIAGALLFVVLVPIFQAHWLLAGVFAVGVVAIGLHWHELRLSAPLGMRGQIHTAVQVVMLGALLTLVALMLLFIGEMVLGVAQGRAPSGDDIALLILFPVMMGVGIMFLGGVVLSVVDGLLRPRRVKRGTVVWADLPYEENTDLSKRRPALVLDVAGDIVEVLKITTKGRVRPEYLELESAEWDAQRRTSFVDRERRVRIHRSLIHEVSGTPDKGEWEAVKAYLDGHQVAVDER